MGDLKIGQGLAPIQQHGIIPTRPLVLGIPAKPVRPLDKKDFEMIRNTISDYQNLKEIYSSSSQGGGKTKPFRTYP
jgi:carbonic anhydrase/acetyltransferase-like protein (isoleucine patch superfamily)